MVQRLDAEKDPDVELRGAEIEARPVLEPQRIDVARLIARDAGGVGPARRRQRPVVRERARQLLVDAVIARIETCRDRIGRSEEHTSELQSLMRISYAVFCLKKKKKHTNSDT